MGQWGAHRDTEEVLLVHLHDDLRVVNVGQWGTHRNTEEVLLVHLHDVRGCVVHRIQCVHVWHRVAMAGLYVPHLSLSPGYVQVAITPG